MQTGERGSSGLGTWGFAVRRLNRGVRLGVPVPETLFYKCANCILSLLKPRLHVGATKTKTRRALSREEYEQASRRTASVAGSLLAILGWMETYIFDGARPGRRLIFGNVVGAVVGAPDRASVSWIARVNVSSLMPRVRYNPRNSSSADEMGLCPTWGMYFLPPQPPPRP